MSVSQDSGDLGWGRRLEDGSAQGQLEMTGDLVWGWVVGSQVFVVLFVLYNIHVQYLYPHFKNTTGKKEKVYSIWNAVYYDDQQLGKILDHLHI